VTTTSHRLLAASAATAAALLVGAVPAYAAGAPAAPTDVTVAWQDVVSPELPPEFAPPAREVLVSWSGATDVTYRVCADGAPGYLCVTSTPEHPTSVALGVDYIPESPATRISVVAIADGQPDSDAALSPVFDSLRPDAPALYEVRPTASGGLVLSWTRRVLTTDPNPGDPLDLEPPLEPTYRVGHVDADWVTYDPPTTATTATLDEPRGGLFAVAEVDEWNLRRIRSNDPSVVNVWMTDVTALSPGRAAYRTTATVRGSVLSNAYWCYGSPPHCASDDGPGNSYATRPSAGRTVQLQVRSGGTWKVLATTSSRSDGTFSFRVPSNGTRKLRALALPTTSPDAARAADAGPAADLVSYQRLRAASLSRTRAEVGARVTTSVRIGERCVSRAALQRRTPSGDWVTVRRASLASGTAVTSLTVRRGTTAYRWKVASCTAPNGRAVAGDVSGTMTMRGR
jgi:hypothetical protein